MGKSQKMSGDSIDHGAVGGAGHNPFDLRFGWHNHRPNCKPVIANRKGGKPETVPPATSLVGQP